MKIPFLSIAGALLLLDRTTGFAPLPLGVARTVALNAVELTPEPEGGEVLTAVKTMDGSKMKNMGAADGVKSDEGTVYKFWLSAVAQGALVKDLNTEVLKDAKKKANFPGFRKGQVPPYAMPQIRGFAVQEGIVQTVQSAIDAYGLKTISGKDGEMEVLEDVAEIAKGYKVGDDIQFTATFQAIFDPEVVSAAESDAIDVEAEST
mmetsp:Transcript_119775/g.346195  ORF Transcript_119775/g.346195 Transcript_119775/m.346195 type:complete len:205 (-) Transcript_119775:191-805(-)